MTCRNGHNMTPDDEQWVCEVCGDCKPYTGRGTWNCDGTYEEAEEE